MRKTLASFVVAATLVAMPAVARADRPESEIVYGMGAALTNLFYTPAKAVVAMIGLPLGAFAGLATGGDTRASYALWVPTVGGTWFLTSAHMAGEEPVEFLGSDYVDRPGVYGRTHHGGAAYDAGYVSRR
jgi:hypothetical protein